VNSVVEKMNGGGTSFLINHERHEGHERGNRLGWEAFLLLIIVGSFSGELTTENTEAQRVKY
jgi:hypothetical protein